MRETTSRSRKVGDQMVEQIKRWIIAGHVKPGDRLPKEAELLDIFGLSKGTVREALNSLEVQGLVTMRTGPDGGATIAAVPFDRTFQLLQNFFFFREVDLAQIYELRRLLEPELVAGAVPHITEETLRLLEASIDFCAPAAQGPAHALDQRAEDLHFHDILAEANPNEVLRFMCQALNEMLVRSVRLARGVQHDAAFGRANVVAHRKILEALRERDATRARALMLEHIIEAEDYVKRLRGEYLRSLVLESDGPPTIALTPAGRQKAKTATEADDAPPAPSGTRRKPRPT